MKRSGEIFEALGFGRTAAERLATARLRGLRNLARRVLIDRNNTVMRSHLRDAIKCVRISRDALRAGNIERHESERDRARMHVAHARLAVFQPAANALGSQRETRVLNAQRGSKATAEKYALPNLDDLIDGCITRGDPMRAKEWADDFDVSLRTIQRRIKARRQAKTTPP